MKINTDIAIIGGGVAGLFALNRLKSLGYSAILLENKALGSGQTIKSQGIIHGGLKFALQGLLNPAAKAVESMPARWKSYLDGTGEIDLRDVKILSDEQLLWSCGNLGSDLSTFFASLILNARVKKLKPNQFPVAFQSNQFRGQVFKLHEIVIDPHSLLSALSKNHTQALIKIDEREWDREQERDSIKPIQDPTSPFNLKALQVQCQGKLLEIVAQHYVLTAGAGNGEWSTYFPEQLSPQQMRPLHMVIVKLNQNLPLFAHCIGSGAAPRITITSHTAQDGHLIWYLGGEIAESGVHRTPTEQILFAKQELQTLFPWLSFDNAQFASFMVNRAEPKQPGGKRPDSAFLQTVGNVSLVWPTKLALTPIVTENLLQTLKAQGIHPTISDQKLLEELRTFNLPTPQVASKVWDELLAG